MIIQLLAGDGGSKAALLTLLTNPRGLTHVFFIQLTIKVYGFSHLRARFPPPSQPLSQFILTLLHPHCQYRYYPIYTSLLFPLPTPPSPLPTATCFQTIQTDRSKIQPQLCHFPFSLGGTQLRIKPTLFNVIYKFYSCVIRCEDTECHPALEYFSHWHCNHNRFHYPFLPVKASGDSVNCKWSLIVAAPIKTISAINSFIGVHSSTYLLWLFCSLGMRDRIGKF